MSKEISWQKKEDCFKLLSKDEKEIIYMKKTFFVFISLSSTLAPKKKKTNIPLRKFPPWFASEPRDYVKKIHLTLF